MSKRSVKLMFPGSQGTDLAARLDLPPEPPRAFALFAHCFTCSKDAFAASRVSGELAKRGFAVLRFDFTGLGASEGDFANTNFSSNVEDLLRAVDFLRTHYEAPEVLVGHSLGGAAVLSAAGSIPEARAVATIGAPSDTAHVIKHFKARLDEIREDGVAEVTLAGRRFTIKKQFLDDLEAQELAARIATMNRALLIFHAPRDEIVGIENAQAIYEAARHPKSFISLDDADHLLSRRADAVYVADVLAAWASRYLGPEGPGLLPVPGPDGVASVAETGAGKFQNQVVAGAHELLADEPEAFGGLGSGPSPYDYLNIALASCTSMTLRMYAARKGYEIARFRVHVSHDRVHAKDCQACGEQHIGKDGRIDRFTREIEIEGLDDAAIRARMIEIADKCPVHRTLSRISHITTTLKPAP